jgi:hypothetical protein
MTAPAHNSDDKAILFDPAVRMTAQVRQRTTDPRPYSPLTNERFSIRLRGALRRGYEYQRSLGWRAFVSRALQFWLWLPRALGVQVQVPGVTHVVTAPPGQMAGIKDDLIVLEDGLEHVLTRVQQVEANISAALERQRELLADIRSEIATLKTQEPSEKNPK